MTDHDCNEHWHIMSSGRACRGRAKDYFAECEICGRTEAPEEVNHTLAYLRNRIADFEGTLEVAEGDRENWKWQVTAGYAELRKCIEAGGGVWRDEESAVSNATMIIEALREKIADFEETADSWREYRIGEDR